MNKETNKCDWCRKETNMPQSFVAMSPIQPKMEKKINEAINKYGNEWWVGCEKEDPKLFDELPEPTGSTKENSAADSENEDDLQQIIDMAENDDNEEINESGSLENLILEEINQN